MIKSEDKLVSILIPAHNVQNYVGRAIESALSQTYKNVEIIVIDDGSTDKTADIVKKYLGDKRVRYVYQENKRLAGARNMGMKTAKGDYFAMLDADDVFLPEKIEEQVKYFQAHPECDVCYCDLWLFYEKEPDKLVETKYKFYSGRDVLPNLIKRSFINTLTVMIKREAVEKFGYLDERYTRAEDLEYFLRLAYAGANFCFLDKKLAKFCIRQKGPHQSGFEGDLNNKLSTLQIYEELEQKMKPEDRKKYNMKKHISYWQIKCALVYFINKNRKSALEYLLKSIRSYPLIIPVSGVLAVGFSIIPIGLASGLIYKMQILRRMFFLKKSK